MSHGKLKEALFELVEVGEQFGPIEETVSDHKIKRFAFSVDDYNPWYFGESPFGRRIGHAAILANDLCSLYNTKYDPATDLGLHTHEELRFSSPVFVGERVSLRGRFVEKYVRRGLGYVVDEAEARGQDGRLLVRHRGRAIMRVQPGAVVGRRTAEISERRVTGEYNKELPIAARARADLETGAPVTPLTKHFYQDQVSIFSYVDRFARNIHTDLEAARRAGLPTTVAQGLMASVFLSEMLTNFFGPSWFTSGWISTKYIQPMYVGQTLTTHGVVTGRTEVPEGVRLDLELWVRNDAGQLAVVGWANALVGENGVAGKRSSDF